MACVQNCNFLYIDIAIHTHTRSMDQYYHSGPEVRKSNDPMLILNLNTSDLNEFY